MELDLRSFTLPKSGHAASENEDAFAYDTEGARSGGNLGDARHATRRLRSETAVRIAVADGATESSFADTWARLIVKAFCRPAQSVPGAAWGGRFVEQSLRQQTARSVDRAARAWDRCYGNRPLSWYAEKKRDLGAFAALAGLRLCPAKPPQIPGTWTAIAIGDACLFQFRSGSLWHAFPIGDHTGFSDTPRLLPSKRRSDEDFVSQSGYWDPGDEFVLATDALACWILQASSLGEDVATQLRNLSSFEDFEAWVEQLRNADGPGARLRDDDVTLAWCTIPADTVRLPGP